MNRFFTYTFALLFTIGFAGWIVTAQTPPTSQPNGSNATKPGTIEAKDPAFLAAHHLKAETGKPLEGEMIELKWQSDEEGTKKRGKFAAYLAEPGEPLPGAPALIVIHEWWGLNKHIKETADNLARAGYTALAVDLYDGKTAEDSKTASTYMQAVESGPALAKLLAGGEYLGKGRDNRPIGSIGWCFGGGWSCQVAIHDSALDAAVIFYGRLPQTVEEVTPINAPLLGIFAEKDGWVNQDMVTGFEEAAKDADLDLEVHWYKADHAFANPSNDNYDEASAKAAWEEVYKFLRAELVK